MPAASAAALVGAVLSAAGVPDAPAHELRLYGFAEHDGLQLDVPVSRVGVGAEYDHRLFGPVSAFGALEASLGRDHGAASTELQVEAKGGFEVSF